ncbi:MAG: ATP-binding protein [Patescibacteria group bacterium]|jgi:PAS domain S-box-containing protein
MRIRPKIILIFITLSFIGGAIGFFVTYFLAKNILITTIGNYNALLAEANIGSIDRSIYRRLERWESYTKSNKDLIDSLNVSNQEFDVLENREAYIKNQGDLWQKTEKDEITPFMRSIIDNSLSESLRLRTEFYQNKYGYDIFPEIIVTNKYGVNVAQTRKTTDYYQADEEWWQKTKAERLWTSDIIYDDSSGIYALELCIRVDDQNGNFLGVTKVIYNVEDIFDVIKEIKEPEGIKRIYNLNIPRETLEVYLLTKEGNLIYSLKDGFGSLSDKSYLLSSLQSAAKNRMAFFIDQEGEAEKLFNYAQAGGYRDFNGLGWYLVISKETKEVLAPLNELTQASAFSVVIAVFIVIFIGLFVANSLVRPIKKLRRGVEIIEKGNLDYRVGTKGKDEIGDFSRAFDRMVLAIKKSRAEVDQKVEEQTKEIITKQKDLENQQKATLNILEDVEEEKGKVSLEKEKIDAILHSIGDGVFVVNTNLEIIMYNEIAAKFSGYSTKEAIGKKYDQILKFVFEKDGQVNDQFIKDAIRTGRIKDMANHTVLIRKDKTKLAVADSAAPLKDKNGKAIGCVVVFRDVTKEREIDKMKTEFVSLASHQLRTPLSAIKWFLEMVLGGDTGKITEEQKDFLQQAFDSNERMIKLVNGLLNVSRIESGRMALEPEPTDLVKLSEIVINEQKSTIKAHNLNFKFSKPKGLPKIKIDPKLINQVIANLISNAIKYTKSKGQIDFKIEVKGKEVVFSVKDTGLGIPKKQQSQIFQKFFRADNVASTDVEGTGLGLYVAKAVVEASGGKIGFSSVENKGSTFWFTLPLIGSKRVKGEKSLEAVA